MSDRRMTPGKRIWRCSFNYKKQKSKVRVTVTFNKDGYIWTDDGLRYREDTLKLSMPGDKSLSAGFYNHYWLEV